MMFQSRRSIIVLLLIVALIPATAGASNLANPAIAIAEARAAIGLSYHLGGYTITNDSVPIILNRINARFSFAPVKWLNFGVDAGATQVEVGADTTPTDTFGVFHGNYGISGGAHLRASTPFFFNDIMAIVGLAQGTYFSSENKYGAVYGGLDAIGALGPQFHIKGFGYITVGPMLYYISGTNKSSEEKTGYYSNISNLRGWLAIDFFPKMGALSSGKTYISLEVSASPLADYGTRVPVREFSVSLAVGTITKRLYGEETDVEWEP